MDSMPAWLQRLGLERYVQVFAENDVDLEAVRLLGESDLEKLGVSLGHRKRLLKAIAELDGVAPAAQLTVVPTGSRASEADTAPAVVTTEAGERRQLTVLFCDMVGFTELANRVDPEVLQRIIRSYEDACAVCITRYEEALIHLDEGTALLGGLPTSNERLGAELQLQLQRATALLATKGMAAVQTGEAYAAAWRLWDQLGGDVRGIFPALYGIYSFHFVRGEYSQSLESAQEALRRAQQINELNRPFYLAELAAGAAEAKHEEEAECFLNEAVAQADASGESWCEAEMYLLKGEFRLAQDSAAGAAQAVDAFLRSLDVARSQSAKEWEVRTAISLARLWQSQGKHKAAHDLLAPIYAWFNEGFDTKDLIEAKALLDELDAVAS